MYPVRTPLRDSELGGSQWMKMLDPFNMAVTLSGGEDGGACNVSNACFFVIVIPDVSFI